MVRKFIFIPVVNNFHLLEKAVRSVTHGIYDEYIIVNNSSRDVPKHIYEKTPFRILTPIKRLGFIDTQNLMRQYAIDNNFDYYVFMHDDAELFDGVDVDMVKYCDKLCEDGIRWGMTWTNQDAYCTISTLAAKEVGPWGDELWPKSYAGYYSDNDYFHRVHIARFKICHLPNGRERVSHLTESTIKKDPKEMAEWQSFHRQVAIHYIQKWGGLPGKETKRIPFGPDHHEHVYRGILDGY